jgi:hypothetical protein
MHDTSVLFQAIEPDTRAFLHPPHDIYFFGVFVAICLHFIHTFVHIYLSRKILHGIYVDYPNSLGYLAAYMGHSYHVPGWRRGVAPSCEQETFNNFHSSSHNVVERTFGVWKMKWKILMKMPSYLKSSKR